MSEEDDISDEALDRAEYEYFQGAPESPLYHYTDAAGFQGIVQSGQFWATNVSFMNDRQEFNYGLSIAKDRILHHLSNEYQAVPDEVIRTLDVYFSALQPRRLFTVSFTEQRDKLSQWRGYAPSNGYCMGFDFTTADGLPRPSRVFYEDSLPKPFIRIARNSAVRLKAVAGLERDSLDLHATPLDLQELLLLMDLERTGMAMKDPGFSEELEWRLVEHCDGSSSPVYYRAGDLGLTPFVKLPQAQEFPKGSLPLISVIVAPGAEAELRANTAREFLYQNGYHHVEVSTSQIPFRPRARII